MLHEEGCTLWQADWGAAVPDRGCLPRRRYRPLALRGPAPIPSEKALTEAVEQGTQKGTAEIAEKAVVWTSFLARRKNKRRRARRVAIGAHGAFPAAFFLLLGWFFTG